MFEKTYELSPFKKTFIFCYKKLWKLDVMSIFSTSVNWQMELVKYSFLDCLLSLLLGSTKKFKLIANKIVFFCQCTKRCKASYTVHCVTFSIVKVHKMEICCYLLTIAAIQSNSHKLSVPIRHGIKISIGAILLEISCNLT